MCTSLSMDNGSFCFGRNMDIEFQLDSKVVAVPRRFPLRFSRAGEKTQHYALLGMATVIDGYPLFADAMNEAGLCMAALSFPDCAYNSGSGSCILAPHELIPYVLSSCSTLAEAEKLLRDVRIEDIPFSKDVPNTPLHWHVADKSGSLAVECTSDGVNVMHDPVGVLTNSPPLSFHLTNLRQYVNLTAEYPKSRSGMEMEPFGRGFGAVGLPGDLSPASRFVRAAFLKLNSPCEEDSQRQIAQTLHVLGSVSMPRGSVITADGREELTAYTSCMNGTSYYHVTYYGMRLHRADMSRYDLDGEDLIFCKEEM